MVAVDVVDMMAVDVVVVLLVGWEVGSWWEGGRVDEKGGGGSVHGTGTGGHGEEGREDK